MNISRLSLLLAFAGFGLTACDNVDEGERFEGPLDLEEVLAKSEKNVLIEDFTGQRCTNCPNAAQKIHEFQEQYGKDRVIAVAIHGGGFGVDEIKPNGQPNPNGLRLARITNTAVSSRHNPKCLSTVVAAQTAV